MTLFLVTSSMQHSPTKTPLPGRCRIVARLPASVPRLSCICHRSASDSGLLVALSRTRATLTPAAPELLHDDDSAEENPRLRSSARLAPDPAIRQHIEAASEALSAGLAPSMQCSGMPQSLSPWLGPG